MMKRYAPAWAGWGAALLLTVMSSAAERKTESFPNNNKGFGQFNERIRAMHGRNLLARRGLRVLAGRLDAAELADGDAGVRGDVGRVNIAGCPTVITYYLGQPKPVYEVGFFTFNGDSRANQDFEVRLADNSAKPGQEPTFPKAPTLTTGEKVLGADRGGFHTSFVSPDGGPLVKGKVDWVQFRIWRTYGANAGSPAKKEAPGWTAAIGHVHRRLPPRVVHHIDHERQFGQEIPFLLLCEQVAAEHQIKGHTAQEHAV